MTSQENRSIEHASPLSGVRVLELGSLIAGPFAGRLLADFGAEVIKIEDPRSPDPFRQWGIERSDGRPLWWMVQSRNKKLITLDLRSERGKELLFSLVETSDVLVENFRPGTLEKWGIGPEELWNINPGLIIARVSGYGQSGRYSKQPGYASVAEALGGMRYLNGSPGEPPPRTGLSLGDSLAGMFTFQGVMMALYWRDAKGGGTGQLVDVSLVDSCFSMLESVVPEYAAVGAVRQPSGTGIKGLAPSNLFKSRDDKWIIIAANQDSVFRRLVGVMDMPELAQDPRFSTHIARGVNQNEIESIVGEWARHYSSEELISILSTASVPGGPVYTIADIFADPYFDERELLIQLNDPVLGPITMPGVVPKLSRTPGEVKFSGSPFPGLHNQEVYGELLDLDADDLEELNAVGVI